MGAGQSWWRVGERIAERGHRVVALDLPGRGESAPQRDLTVPRAAQLVTDTWFSLFLGPPILAVGHSYGGLVLGAAVEHLRPASVVYVDAPSRQRGGWAPDGVRHEYASDKAARTYDGLRERRPHYSHRDCLVEARAAKLFDVETAVGLAAGPGGDWTPSAPPRSLMVRPDPSMCVPDEDAELLRARDVEVRHIPGAEHSVWYSHFDAFMSAIADR